MVSHVTYRSLRQIATFIVDLRVALNIRAWTCYLLRPRRILLIWSSNLTAAWEMAACNLAVACRVTNFKFLTIAIISPIRASSTLDFLAGPMITTPIEAAVATTHLITRMTCAASRPELTKLSPILRASKKLYKSFNSAYRTRTAFNRRF